MQVLERNTALEKKLALVAAELNHLRSKNASVQENPLQSTEGVRDIDPGNAINHASFGRSASEGNAVIAGHPSIVVATQEDSSATSKRAPSIPLVKNQPATKKTRTFQTKGALQPGRKVLNISQGSIRMEQQINQLPRRSAAGQCLDPSLPTSVCKTGSHDGQLVQPPDLHKPDCTVCKTGCGDTVVKNEHLSSEGNISEGALRMPEFPYFASSAYQNLEKLIVAIWRLTILEIFGLYYCCPPVHSGHFICDILNVLKFGVSNISMPILCHEILCLMDLALTVRIQVASRTY